MRKPWHLPSAMVLFAALFPAAVALAQNGNAIRGKVVSDTGRQVDHVVIYLEDANGSLVGQTVTNSEGDFEFTGLPGLAYVVLIKEVDYEPVRERLEFAVKPDADQPGERRYLSISLTPKVRPLPRASGTVFAQSVPPAARAAYDEGAQLARAGRSADAIAAYRKAIAAFPDYFDAHFALGNELANAGQVDDSMRELDRAREINPKDARVYAAFGSLLVKQHKLAVAAAAFGEAGRLSPTEPQYPLARATVLIDQASLIDPTRPDTAKVRSALLDEASRDLDRAFSVSGRALVAVHLQRARMYERRGDRKAAADELEVYLQASPNAPNAAAIRESIGKLRSGRP